MRRLSSILAIMAGLFIIYLAFASSSVYSGENKPLVSEHKITKQEISKEFTCPVCGMNMKVAKNTPALDYKGKTYYFCSAGEKMPFSKNPEKYVSAEESPDSLKLGYTEHKITDAELGKEATCPVTKKSFKISKETPAINFQGKTYYFCCPGCLDKFMASQTASDSLKVEPDSLHPNQSSGEGHKHKGCC